MIRRILAALTLGATCLASGTCVPNETFVPTTGNCSGTDGGPVLCLVAPSPTNGVMEYRAPNMTFDVIVAVGNFTLRDPGGCGSVSNTCGHLHLFLDDGMCPQVGMPYIISSDTRIPVQLGSCPTPFGNHTIRVELHDDVHNPLTPSVTVSETFPAMQPM